jgi:alpha-L-fucosidase
VLREPIALGQRVARFRLEVWSAEHGRWIPFASGTTIGNRRILRVPELTAQRVRLAIDRSRACPALSGFALYLAPAPVAR